MMNLQKPERNSCFHQGHQYFLTVSQILIASAKSYINVLSRLQKHARRELEVITKFEVERVLKTTISNKSVLKKYTIIAI